MLASKITCSSVIILSVFIAGRSHAQERSLPKWEAGIHGGVYVYRGDLTPNQYGSFETIQPGFGLSVNRIINNRFSARLMFTSTRLHADESVYTSPAWRQQRNFRFSTTVQELALSLHWNFLGSNYEDVKWQPYVFAGAGASLVNINRDFSRINLDYFGETSYVPGGLAADAATVPPNIIAVVPVGAGFRYHISNRLVANLEMAYRFTLTDYLDGFSKSANPTFKDHYSNLVLGLSYKFGSGGNGNSKYGCPAVN